MPISPSGASGKPSSGTSASSPGSRYPVISLHLATDHEIREARGRLKMRYPQSLTCVRPLHILAALSSDDDGPFLTCRDQLSGNRGDPRAMRWVSEIVIGGCGCDSCGSSSVRLIVARASTSLAGVKTPSRGPEVEMFLPGVVKGFVCQRSQAVVQEERSLLTSSCWRSWVLLWRCGVAALYHPCYQKVALWHVT